ncbi:carboxypeptidase-like regulatory domain-containing protein [Infirmifilum sp. NZ]|uniref:carboxypeptidase-like regulatory domain-containing protein n=1 Tax=Infirmifilum sp. NZ TaxID=2926850 RepID=UPI0027AA8FB3|nr:carboxypeptidase-like regulatory domain-containing protein [Infirmifilum sp. NZ]UNQ74299.1 carboxypeptidase-like regulatory domain-containing protein [Infirmifilum sp. NZ]
MFVRDSMRIVGVMLLLLLALNVALVALADKGSQVFYVKLDYILRTEEGAELDFGSKSVITLSSTATPPGYVLESFSVIFEGKAPPQIVPVKYDKVSESMGRLTSVTSYSGEVVLGSNGFNGTVKARLVTVFRKTTWMPLQDNITVDTSEFKDTGLSVSVRVTIDNYAPYAVKTVIDPFGNDLTQIDVQAAVPAGAFKVDPKHVEIDVSSIGYGKYTIEFSQGEEYKLPNAFLVIEDRFTETTIPAKTFKSYSIRGKAGWNPLGFIVVLYSVAPGPLTNSATVEGNLIDLAFERSEEFEVRGASLLIPPFLMHYWIKAFIVYGTTAKIVNNEGHDIQAMIIPVYYREVGTWTPRGLTATINKKDIADAYAAYLVVQVPPIATITSVTVPSGQKFDDIENYTADWLGTWRTIVLEKNEAAVQVKNGDSVEEGEYFISIAWKPIKMIFKDPKGNPVPGVQVSMSGPLSINAVSGADGSAQLNVYAPGVYSVSAAFKGATLTAFTLGTLMDTEFNIECKVYTMTVHVKNALGGPVAGAVVTVSNGNYSQSLESDASGSAVFTQLPRGTYTVTAQYKRITSTVKVTLDGDQAVDLNTGILLDLPFVGPVTATEVAAVSAATAVTAALFFRPRKEKDTAEIEIG